MSSEGEAFIRGYQSCVKDAVLELRIDPSMSAAELVKYLDASFPNDDLDGLNHGPRKS